MYIIRDTAVKRVLQRPAHELCRTRLRVIAVELDDVDDAGDQDVCRTFSAACAPGDLSLSCALHNYLVSVGVRDARFEWDDRNGRIVVVVTSDEGTTRLKQRRCNILSVVYVSMC